MKKQIIKEINRTREIMGLSKLLLTEQSSLLKFFMKSFAKTKNVWTSLNKTVLHQFGKVAGAVPISKIAKLDGMVDILNTVMENTMLRVRNNGQAMKTKFFGAGIDMTEEQAARLGKAWTEGDASFAVAVKNMRGAGKIDDITSILIKPGKEASGLQAPMIDAISSAINPKNTDEFRIILKEAGMPSTKVDEIMESINMYGHIGSGKNLEEVFGVLIDFPSYQAQMIKSLKNSGEFQDLVRLKGAEFSETDLANLMGRETTDGTVKLIYAQVIKQTVKEWVFTKGKAFFHYLFGTWPGRIFVASTLLTLGWNYFCDSIYSVWGKKKAGLTPDMYLDVYTNKIFIKKLGGYTDPQAKAAALTIYKSFGWGYAQDTRIVDEYKKMPSILAASQVAYWYEKLEHPTKIDDEKFLDDDKTPNPNYNKKARLTAGTLYELLMDMDIEWLPKGATMGLDWSIKKVVDVLNTKQWTTSEGTTSKLKYATQVKENWPRYQPMLKDANKEKYYCRYKGPIDLELLGVLLQDCPNADGSDLVQDDCLRKFKPGDFNSAYQTVDPNNTVPVYSVNATEAKDQTDKFYKDFLKGIEEVETPDWLDKSIAEWEKRID